MKRVQLPPLTSALPGGQRSQGGVGLHDRDTLFGDVLTARFGGTDGEHRRRRAVTGHAISFWTWRSLCLDQGLSDAEAVDAMTGMILAIAPVLQSEPAR